MLNARCSSALLFLIAVAGSNRIEAQSTNTSQGTDFWLGFMENYQGSLGSLDLFITSDVNTFGTVSIPGLGLSWSYVVAANTTTTVSLPYPLAMHTGSDVIDTKAVHVVANDPVSLYAINFEPYTADGSAIYPVPATGTRYRLLTYQGLDGFTDLVSEFLVVAQEDGTEVEITTTANTLGGQVGGVPFIVLLDQGESYQVKAADPFEDFTGTTITGTSSNGACRSFAVFAGAVCTNVPVGCVACDHLYEQMLPASGWGTTYHTTPFATTTGYTYRILADEDATQVTVNGGAPQLLNAGEWLDLSNVPAAACIEGNLPFQVAQYMQGVNCGGNGDPALIVLNAADNEIDAITFSTVVSTVITAHYVNLIVDGPDIGTVLLDGVQIPPAAFVPYTGCATKAYASQPLSPGSHSLACAGGFIAYLYGMGAAESYAYSLGSRSAAAVDEDSLICVPSGTTVTLIALAGIVDPFWTTAADPLDTLSTDSFLVVTVTGSASYVASSSDPSDCGEFGYVIGTTDPISVLIAVDSLTVDTLAICANGEVLVQAIVPGDPGDYAFSWSGGTGITTLPNGYALVTLSSGPMLHVIVTQWSGCSFAQDSMVIVDDLSFSVISSPDTSVCGPTSTITIGAVVSGGPAASVLWDTDFGIIASPFTLTTNVTSTITSIYVITVTSAIGCLASDVTVVTVLPTPPVPGIAPSGSTLTAPPGYTYQWYLNGVEIIGATGQSITAFVNGFYSVEVTDANGCSSTSPYYNMVNAGLGEMTDAGIEVWTDGNEVVIGSATGAIDEVWIYGPLGQLEGHRRGANNGLLRLPVRSTGIHVVQVSSNGRLSTWPVAVFP